MTIYSESNTASDSEWIHQLEHDIHELEEKLRNSRGEAEELFPSLLEARALITAGFLGISGAGFLASLTLRVILEPSQIRLIDPVIGGIIAIQRGLQALGRWAPVAAFSVGLLLLLFLVLRHFSGREWDAATRPRADWKAWAVALALIIIPFYDFRGAGDSFGLPVGFAIACGIYGFVPVLQRSPAVQRIFEHFESPWFGLALVISAVSLVATGYLMPSASAVMAGVLLASCFSLKLMFLGIQKRAKVRELEEHGQRLERLRAERETRWSEERLDVELDAFVAEREIEERNS